MSNQNQKTICDIALDFTKQEIDKLQNEVAFLLENPVTKEDIERIERRLEELERCFIK